MYGGHVDVPYKISHTPSLILHLANGTWCTALFLVDVFHHFDLHFGNLAGVVSRVKSLFANDLQDVIPCLRVLNCSVRFEDCIHLFKSTTSVTSKKMISGISYTLG